MRVEDFEYRLPPERIAQSPAPDRSSSRLLVLRRESGDMEDLAFTDLPRFLQPGDLLVVNDTRVAPARLSGTKKTGGRVEITLTARLGPDEWEALIKGRKIGPGQVVDLGPGASAEVLGLSGSEVRVSPEKGAPLWRVRLSGPSEKLIEKIGLPPLPPYIKRAPGHDPAGDRERYQTVYAREGQAAAAPTAGLHFSEELLDRIRLGGIEVARVRLDVSFGTFAPVREERVEDHRMHPENCRMPAQTARAVNDARARGGRVVAVGTTVVRTLEHFAADDGTAREGEGETSLFILPGYRFKTVDLLLTNFHMPGSTLIMLVAAFAGKDRIMKAYQHAIESGYRFLSYGDAMLII